MSRRAVSPAARWMGALLVVVAGASLQADDWPMWGGTPDRNMTSTEVGLPSDWSTADGTNVTWTAALGSSSYGNPVVAGGRVFVGTNNDAPRDAAVDGDKGIVMAFRETDGAFLWQMVHDKLETGEANDWPYQGVCSSPTVVGDRLYYLSNRGEVVALDTEGFLDGENDGAVIDERRAGDADADVVWVYDMIGQLGVHPHNMTSSAPVVHGDLVIVNTSNGTDEEGYVVSPESPDLIALDRETGTPVWQVVGAGEWILHGQWSSPAVAEIGGVTQVVIGQGDGWVRGYDVTDGTLLWEYDTNPVEAQWPTTRNNVIATPVVWNDRVYVANGQDPENGEGEGRLHAIDATLRGDISETGGVWQFDEIRRSLTTVAIADGLLYVADFSGYLRCLDAETGEELWVHDTFAAIWGSPLVADGKVYLGDEDGDVVVLRAGRELEVLAENNLGSPIYGAPIAANGVLYINTVRELYALEVE